MSSILWQLQYGDQADLRKAETDETPLSREEVAQGLREGVIPPGPVACARVFAEVWVAERRRVEVVNFLEFEQ